MFSYVYLYPYIWHCHAIPPMIIPMPRLSKSYEGWRCYAGHRVRNAGLGLSCLYMTVLGFDSITWGYSLMQCVSESVLGILVAVSAGVG